METGPTTDDAFGQLLLDTWRGGDVDRTAVEIIERDDGHIGTGDAARYFATPDDWPPIERDLLERARGRVLDIGCGAGRHALALQDNGLEVTGLDVSPGAISVCRERGVQSLFHGSIDDLAATQPPPFDTFVMLGNNLGLLHGASRAGGVLRRLAGLAAPGAQIIGNTVDPYETDIPEHRMYHDRNRSHGRMGGQMRIRVRHRALASEWWDYLMFSGAEVPGLVEGSGWRVAELLRDGPRVGLVLTLR